MAKMISNRKLVRLAFFVLPAMFLLMVYRIYYSQVGESKLFAAGKPSPLYRLTNHDVGLEVEATKPLAGNGLAGETTHHRVPDYADSELSKNFMDINKMDAAFVKSFDADGSKLNGNAQNNTDFQYPEFGYRYQNILTKAPDERNNGGRIESFNETLNKFPKIKATVGYREITEQPKKTSGKPKSTAQKQVKRQVKALQDKTQLPPPIDTLQSQGPTPSRYIVYLCDTSKLCGGWGDRQRGITSLYLLARLVDRQFKIIMATPCDLSRFYIPNKVNWLVTGNELTSSSNIVVNDIFNQDVVSRVVSGDFNQQFPQKVIYVQSNSDYYDKLRKNSIYSTLLNKWGGIAGKRARFTWAWHDLMKPSPLLLTHLERIMGSQFLIRKGLATQPLNKDPKIKSIYDLGNSTLICGHVRMGKNPTIPMDEALSYFSLNDLPVLYDFLEAKDKNRDAYFFVASDFELVRGKSRERFGSRLVDYGGKIIHIDRQRGDRKACVGFEVALMDQLVLSLCDILVICKSGFSKYASYLSNTLEPVYILEGGQIHEFKG